MRQQQQQQQLINSIQNCKEETKSLLFADGMRQKEREGEKERARVSLIL